MDTGEWLRLGVIWIRPALWGSGDGGCRKTELKFLKGQGAEADVKTARESLSPGAEAAGKPVILKGLFLSAEQFLAPQPHPTPSQPPTLPYCKLP